MNAVSVPGTKISELDPIRKLDITQKEVFAVAKGGNNYQINIEVLKNYFRTTKVELGLDKVDNTPDKLKPISVAARMALEGKANLNHEHTLNDIDGLADTLNSINNRLTNLESEPPSVVFVTSEW